MHQVQLAMQNEELRASQVELEKNRSRYFELYDLAPVGHLTVNEQGYITRANLTFATLLGVERSAFDLNMIWVNRAYEKATGLSMEECRERKCYQVWNLSKPCTYCLSADLLSELKSHCR